MPRMLYGTAWKKERTAVLVEQAVLAGFRGEEVWAERAPLHDDGTLTDMQLLTAPPVCLQASTPPANQSTTGRTWWGRHWASCSR